jgi:hypothetical protein
MSENMLKTINTTKNKMKSNKTSDTMTTINESLI